MGNHYQAATQHSICKRLPIVLLLLFTMLSTIRESSALDSTGRIVVAGFVETDFQNLSDTLFSVSRYTTTGLIDTSFATGGIATLDFLRHGIAMDVITTVESGEDKIIVVGTAIDPMLGLPRALIAKFNANGSLDASFNTTPGGILDGGPGWGWLVDGRSIGTGIDPLINFDTENLDGYAACGNIITDDHRYRGFNIAITLPGDSLLVPVELTSNDIKFNSLRTITTSGFIGFINAGKSVQQGTELPLAHISSTVFPPITFVGAINGTFLDTDDGPGEPIYFVGTHANKGLLFALLGSSLTPDLSFGSNGYVTAEFGNKQTTFNAVKVDTDSDGNERILVCGTARSLESRIFVAAYDTSGNLIPSFGENGVQTILEGPNVQTQGVELILPNSITGEASPTAPLFSNCPAGSSTGMFAIGRANRNTPLIANLACASGALQQTSYGDKGIASLATEAQTDTTVLKEQFSTAVAPFIPSMSPALRRFNTLEGNPFAVSLSAPDGFTLEPGRYYIEAEAPIQDVGAHQLQLFNTTLGQQQDVGDSVWNSSGTLTKALIKTMVFVPELTRFELRHFFANTGLNFAAGRAAGISGLATVWAQMQVQQL